MCALAAAAVIVVIFAAAAQVVAIAAAAEQQDQDDDPPATVTAPRITTHNRYLQERFCYGLRRTFHVIPQTRKGAARFLREAPCARPGAPRGTLRGGGGTAEKTSGSDCKTAQRCKLPIVHIADYAQTVIDR